MSKIPLWCSLPILLAGCGHSPPPPQPAKAATQAPLPQPPPATAPSAGAPARASTAPVMPGVLKTLNRLGHMQVVRSFDTSVPGLTGWLVRSNGQNEVLYGTAGGYLIAGALLSPDGHNLTAQFKQQYSPKPDLSSLAGDIAADPTVFTMGTAGPVLTAFVDPNCAYCHKMEDAIAPLIAAGKLRLRVVLVAFVGSSAPARAAAILSATDPAAAMDENRQKYDAAKEQGGYPLGAPPTADQTAALARHMAWMAKLGSSGTPTLMFQDAAGHWDAKPGWPGLDWVQQWLTRMQTATAAPVAPVAPEAGAAASQDAKPDGAAPEVAHEAAPASAPAPAPGPAPETAPAHGGGGPE